ncbi:MAG: ABC transporter permease [Dehalococcoidia bacterium]|nr:ABC transporter permease [Dehalococcoidia bacterium]
MEVKLFIREPIALVFAFAFPFFMLFVLAGVFGNDVDPADEENLRVWRGVGPSDYYVSTYVGLVMASAGLVTLPLRLAAYRDAGVLRRYRAAGVSVPVVLGAQVLVSLGMSVLAAAGIIVGSTLVCGRPPGELAAGYRRHWPWPAHLLMHRRAAGGDPSIRQGGAGAGLTLFFVMMMISGSGPPLEVLTSAMRAVSNAMPLTHLNLVVQDAWLGFGWSWAESLITLAFGAASGILAVRFFRWE